MRDVAYIREDFPPFQRVARLETASGVDAASGLMTVGQAVFTVAENDARIAEVLRGRVVEIVRRQRRPVRALEVPAASGSYCRTYFATVQHHASGPVPLGSISQVRLWLKKVGAPVGTVCVKLRGRETDGDPGAILHTSSTVNCTAISDSAFGWHDFDFSPAVVTGLKSYITLDPTGLTTNDATNYVTWGRTDSDIYGSIHSLYSVDLITWSSVARDNSFQISGDFYEVLELPPWVGYIERPPWNQKRGIVEVECIDVQGKLQERHTGVTGSRSGAAGLIARELLTQANARNPFGLVWDTTSEAGTPVENVDLSGMSLFDAFNQLADLTGDEWWIEYDVREDRLGMYFHWGYQRGFDYSQQVYLRQGHEISSVQYSQDALEDAESVMYVGGGGEIEDRPIVVRARSPEQVSEEGALVQRASETFERDRSVTPSLAAERVVIAPRQTDMTVLARAAERELEAPYGAVESLQMVINWQADWSKLEVGNIVRAKVADVPWGELDRRVRIVEAQPDPAAGELLLEVEVLSDE